MGNINEKKFYKLFMYIMVLFLIIYGISNIWTNKMFFADGSYFFDQLLAKKTFFLRWNNRAVVHILHQLFTVLAIKVGISSIPILGGLYSFGGTFWLVLCYSVSMIICYINHKNDLLLLTSLLILLEILNTGFFIAIESNMACSLFWLIFVIGVTGNSMYSTLKKIIIFFLIALTFKMHEFMAILDSILIMTFYLSDFQKKYKIVSYCMLLVVVIESTLATIFPQKISRRQALISSSIQEFLVPVIIGLILCLIIFIFIKMNLIHNLNKVVYLLLFLVIFGLSIYACLNWKTWFLNSDSRRLGNLLFPALFSGYYLVNQNNFIKIFTPLNLNVTFLIAPCILAGIIFSSLFYVNYSYLNYLHERYDVCTDIENSGFISAYEEGNYNNLWAWSWTINFESLNIQLIKGEKNIDCIMWFGQKTRGDKITPNDIHEYFDLSYYGVRYEEGKFNN